MRELGFRFDERGGELVDRANRVAETGEELIAVLPAFERAVEMATPLEGAIDRFGRFVDLLPGGAARRRAEQAAEAATAERRRADAAAESATESAELTPTPTPTPTPAPAPRPTPAPTPSPAGEQHAERSDADRGQIG
jgi:hypothetical protein